MLQAKYEKSGFSVLAFPTNDFRQEFESNDEIRDFLENEFPELNFPVFGLSALSENPVFRQLRQHIPNEHVQHNFFKYLVGPDGIAIKLYNKQRDPITLAMDIEAQLRQIQGT